jgi:GNAT superfamily N-acetyltransferase
MSASGLRRSFFRLRDVRHAVTASEFARILPAWLVRREYLVTARELSDEGTIVASPPAVRWGALEPADTSLLIALEPMLTEATLQRRMGEGQRCWVAWLEGQPVHWRWEAEGDVYLPYLGRTLRPHDGDLWIVEAYTHPAHRGRGLYTASTALALQQARKRGFTRLLGMVAPWNRPARHVMHDKTGRTVIGTIGYWQVGPWRRYFARGAVTLAPDGSITVEVSPRPVSPPPPPGC